MVIERTEDEILIKIPANMDASRIQAMIDYIRYQELTAKSKATQEDVDDLVREVKKGRWERTKRELGMK